MPDNSISLLDDVLDILLEFADAIEADDGQLKLHLLDDLKAAIRRVPDAERRAFHSELGDIEILLKHEVPRYQPTVSIDGKMYPVPREQRLATIRTIAESIRNRATRLQRLLQVASESKLGTTTRATPDGWIEPIDEPDRSILEFLNRYPTLRRRVSDVLPDVGPQDRKAVAARLRKLADRTPPLVDNPKSARSGVAILPAGIEALKRAQTPR